jgi:hypothetical protein
MLTAAEDDEVTLPIENLRFQMLKKYEYTHHR